MIKIYFKEAKDKYDSVYKLLEHYLSINTNDTTNGYNPATYWEDSHEMQCDDRRNRSFDDLLLLSQYYIPEAKIEDVVNALYQFNKSKESDGLVACIYCSTVQRFVICSSKFSKQTIEGAHYLYDLFPPSDHLLSSGYGKKSQWTLSELKAMVIV